MPQDNPYNPNKRPSSGHIPTCLYMLVATRLAQDLIEVACRNGPVKPPFVGMLLLIRANPGIRQGICADTLGFDATTFGRYIDRLVRDEMVARTIPQEDRRAVCLQLTPKGAAALAESAPLLLQVDQDARAHMGDADWEKLEELLVKFLEAYDNPLPRLVHREKVTPA